jgi:hypothetical protein
VIRNDVAEALMALALQVVSSHHLGALDTEKALSVQELLVKRLLPHAASEAETLERSKYAAILTFPLSGNISQKTNLPTICQL